MSMMPQKKRSTCGRNKKGKEVPTSRDEASEKMVKMSTKKFLLTLGTKKT